ncbi:MAG: copper homeostasis protein CutC [Cytophagales bacterium]|nr:copper homeostasis protein CutC [Cytophagales bacterium]
MIIEACVENIHEALRAESLGAHRVEICENLKVDGTTPSAGTIKVAKKLLKIPIMVLIRPRGGNFIYSRNEIEIMRHDIEVCKKIGVHGVVFGTLTRDYTIDSVLVKELIEIARPLRVTFHKAIDKTFNILEEFRSLLMNTDIDRVLTSGGAKTAFDGKEIINEMVRIANGQVKVISAGKIHQSDLPKLKNIIHSDEFHGKKIVGNLSNLDI